MESPSTPSEAKHSRKLAAKRTERRVTAVLLVLVALWLSEAIPEYRDRAWLARRFDVPVYRMRPWVPLHHPNIVYLYDTRGKSLVDVGRSARGEMFFGFSPTCWPASWRAGPISAKEASRRAVVALAHAYDCRPASIQVQAVRTIGEGDRRSWCVTVRLTEPGRYGPTEAIGVHFGLALGGWPQYTSRAR